MQPIRGKRRFKFVSNPWTQDEQLFHQSDEAHVLGDEGEVQSMACEHLVGCACGCLAEPAGFCADCADRRPICERCLHHCQRCGKSCCGKHRRQIRSGAAERLCTDCHDAADRQRIARTCVRALLSPFIEFNDDDTAD